MIMREFQAKVKRWTIACFGETTAKDVRERNHRFLEEALELVQSLGCTREEALQLVDYVYGRPKGEPYQEVGGVSITLAALCAANKINMEFASEAELTRISEPEVLEKIRAKNLRKQKDSALPGADDANSKVINDNYPPPKTNANKLP